MPRVAPFRLLSNDEFDRLTSLEKMQYIKKASDYLASLLQGRRSDETGRYAGPERRQSRPGYPYQGPERRRAA